MNRKQTPVSASITTLLKAYTDAPRPAEKNDVLLRLEMLLSSLRCDELEWLHTLELLASLPEDFRLAVYAESLQRPPSRFSTPVEVPTTDALQSVGKGELQRLCTLTVRLPDSARSAVWDEVLRRVRPARNT